MKRTYSVSTRLIAMSIAYLLVSCEKAQVSIFQGFMQYQIIASHTCFGGHVNVNC